MYGLEFQTIKGVLKMLFDQLKNKSEDSNQLQVIVGRAKPEDLVVTRNDFPLSSYSIDLNLEKLMYCAMVVVRKTELQNNHDFNPNDLITISAKNFGELTTKSIVNKENPDDKALREIERNAEVALKRIYTKFDNPTMLIYLPNEPDPVKVPMMTRCHYSGKNKSIQIRFAVEFYDYFYQLVKWTDANSPSFSSHELKQVILMESKYGVKLYNILVSYIWRTNEVEIDIEKLRWLFHCFEIKKERDGKKVEPYRVELYTELYNFKKRVLDMACKDINANTNLEVTYENVKNGKEVVGIKFKFNYSKKYKKTEAEKAIDKMKEIYLKNAVPYSEDGTHFKASDRAKYFKAPEKLSTKQISVLVNCPEFLLDYGNFLGNSDTDTGKKIMRTLLNNNLEKVNQLKPIDLDYYFWLQEKKSIEINSNEKI